MNKLTFLPVFFLLFFTAISNSQIPFSDIELEPVENTILSELWQNNDPSDLPKLLDKDDLLLATRTDKYDFSWSWRDSSEYVYNSDNQLSELIIKKFNGIVWATTRRVFYEFTENESLTLQHGQDWENGTWIDRYKYIIDYDANNNVLSRRWQIVTDMEFENNDREVYEYDLNNNNTSITSQTWESGAWINVVKKNFEYDDNNNLLFEVRTFWNEMDWENAQLYSYEYDENDNQISSLVQLWVSNNWVNAQLSVYEYDLNNKKTIWLRQNWNGVEWSITSRNVYKYDLDKITLNLIQDWNDVDWENSSRTVYLYEGNDNTKVLNQNWDGTIWVTGSQSLKEYDAFNNLIFLLVQNWDDGWIDKTRKFYYYQIVSNNSNIETTDFDFEMLPNPVSDYLNITLSSKEFDKGVITLFNGVGQIVKQQLISNSEKIEVTNLPEGLYFLQVKNDRDQSTKPVQIIH